MKLSGLRSESRWRADQSVLDICNRADTGVTVTVRAVSQNTQLTGSKQVAGTFEQNEPPPIVADGGITDAASFRAFPPLAPGTLISISGTMLADQTLRAPTAPWGTFLGDTRLLIAGQSLPIDNAATGQGTAVIPYGIAVNTQQQILQRANTLSLPVQVNLAPASPPTLKATPLRPPIQPGRVKSLLFIAGLGELQQPVTAGSAGPAASATNDASDRHNRRSACHSAIRRTSASIGRHLFRSSRGPGRRYIRRPSARDDHVANVVADGDDSDSVRCNFA
jgi:hypothetical protein